jgi:leucyl aminopeptidase (aminopeptidase T)
MDKKDNQKAIQTILTVNMNIQPGERAIIVADIPRLEDWMGPNSQLNELIQRAVMVRQMFDQAKQLFTGCQIDFLAFPTTGQNGTEPPHELAEKLLDYDVVLLMTTYSLTHTDARVDACKKGARVASMPGFEESMFLPGGPMLADYEQIYKITNQWAEKLTACNQVHIMTSIGTDLTFSIEGRAGASEHGLFHHKGEWGNLPAGEGFIAPVEGTANGRLVVPSRWYVGLKEDMVLEFSNGYVSSLTGGGEVGNQFRNLFRFGEEEFQHRRNCAELGIGTNPNAKNPENGLEAEKIGGTIHIAVGDSAHMQGVTVSDLHEDFIIPNPVVYFDQKQVMGP